jgi:hypothetical protein
MNTTSNTATLDDDLQPVCLVCGSCGTISVFANFEPPPRPTGRVGHNACDRCRVMPVVWPPTSRTCPAWPTILARKEHLRRAVEAAWRGPGARARAASVMSDRPLRTRLVTKARSERLGRRELVEEVRRSL